MSLNKTQLVSEVAASAGIPKTVSEKAVNSVINVLSKELERGENVTLVGFGNFSVYERKERMGKNPQNGKEIKIPAKKVAKFKPGKNLAEMVNKTVVKKKAAPAKKAKK